MHLLAHRASIRDAAGKLRGGGQRVTGQWPLALLDQMRPILPFQLPPRPGLVLSHRPVAMEHPLGIGFALVEEQRLTRQSAVHPLR